MNKPLIIAHRGASALAPENTLSAFRKAMEDGAEGIEFDVRLAGDGVPVVFHDERLDRVGLKNGRVSDFSSGDLQNLDVGTWFNSLKPDRANSEFAKETVPTLRTVLDFLNGFQGIIYIELKCEEAEVKQLVKAVCREIAGSALLPKIILKSFCLQTIPETRRLCPDVKTAALFAPKITSFFRREKYLLRLADELGTDHLSLHYSLISRKLMEKAERKNLPVTIWTADNPLWVKRALNLGIHAIITNNPARLLAKRRQVFQE